MDVRVEASAPSNIAWIKYMGKTATAGNVPTNASLSYTLEHLRTFVEIQSGPAGWEPLPRHPRLSLSDKGRTRFLQHFERLKELWEIQGSFTIRSANNFPSDCGLASSASSFAALTMAAYELARTLRPGFVRTPGQLAQLSRLGSGSSCRSFFGPWALWQGETAEPVELPGDWHHAVVVVEDTIKSVSSSEAHKRVTSSLLFNGRPERAETRLRSLRQALIAERWSEAFELAWSEFWDMHALFETSQPAFGYMTAGSLAVLNRLRQVWQETGDGPLVTMDAGPNVHLLIRPDQLAQASEWLRDWRCLRSWQSGPDSNA